MTKKPDPLSRIKLASAETAEHDGAKFVAAMAGQPAVGRALYTLRKDDERPLLLPPDAVTTQPGTHRPDPTRDAEMRLHIDLPDTSSTPPDSSKPVDSVAQAAAPGDRLLVVKMRRTANKAGELLPPSKRHRISKVNIDDPSREELTPGALTPSSVVPSAAPVDYKKRNVMLAIGLFMVVGLGIVLVKTSQDPEANKQDADAAIATQTVTARQTAPVTAIATATAEPTIVTPTTETAASAEPTGSAKASSKASAKPSAKSASASADTASASTATNAKTAPAVPSTTPTTSGTGKIYFDFGAPKAP